ncbi:oocyte zinc finger protein XlCOF7.1-like isoform X2 [Pseudophryne corroboree]|uniref:oocyte zinc finger protein XlCOF7.1-like isoform X2 n=1 Tax=Pseudophryne corroboree TaxID=495146 RepID=UPI00308187D6
MDKEKSQMTEKILNLTLEIIYLLTGEEYTVVRKTSGETPSSHPCVSGGLSRTQSPITVPPPHSLTHERHNDQKILELTNKIIQLLTGEDEEYTEGQIGLYKDVMMENHWPLTSLGIHGGREDLWREQPSPCVGSIEQSLCVSPTGGSTDRRACSQDRAEESHSVLQEDQDDNKIKIKIEVIEPEEEEETYVMGDQQCKEEEIPTDISTGGPSSRNSSGRHLSLSTDCKIEDNDIAHNSAGENTIFPNIHPVLSSASLSCDPSTNYDDCLHYSDSLTLQQKPDTDKHTLQITQTSGISVHQRSLTGEKPYPCPECGKCFTLRSYLVKHQRIHAAVKPYSCAECGKCFTQKRNHLEHQRIHTGEKPYSCPECGKCFTHMSYLIQHQTIHTGEKPFSCSLCGKYFAQKSRLSLHQRVHIGAKPFSCSDCGKCFTQKSSLVRHQRVHAH